MPQASLVASPFLGICLDRGHATFAPGDVISGHVVRSEHMMVDDATVTISLTGRVKTKIVVSWFKKKISSDAKMYRGWTPLIDERQSPWVLFRGPVFIPPGGAGHAAWPFAITIPTHYLETEGEPLRTLPESFTMENGSLPGFSLWDEGFVEYTIRAEIRSALATTTAILPITLRTTNPGLPIADIPLLSLELFGLASWPDPCPFRPGPREPRPVSVIRRNYVFGHVIIDTPTIIQLEHPDPIPLRLSFSPESALRAVARDAPPLKITLLSLTMEIIPTTEIVADGFAGPRSVIKPAGVIVTVWPPATLSPHAPPLYIPYPEDGPPVNVGKIARLRIGRGGAMSEAFVQGRICPSFSTRNLKYSHSITYRIQASVNGEDMEITRSCEVAVTLLPPARERRLGAAAPAARAALVAPTAPAAPAALAAPAVELQVSSRPSPKLQAPPPLVVQASTPHLELQASTRTLELQAPPPPELPKTSLPELQASPSQVQASPAPVLQASAPALELQAPPPPDLQASAPPSTLDLPASSSSPLGLQKTSLSKLQGSPTEVQATPPGPQACPPELQASPQQLPATPPPLVRKRRRSIPRPRAMHRPLARHSVARFSAPVTVATTSTE